PESVDGPVERFVPAGGSEHAIVTDQRLGESRVFLRTCLRHGCLRMLRCTDAPTAGLAERPTVDALGSMLNLGRRFWEGFAGFRADRRTRTFESGTYGPD